jgi:glycosyltransferase involved in cell wall biosynthesis
VTSAFVEVSLVICTRDRASKLQRCLESVAEVRPGRSWEVVVVDNASTDDTLAVVERARCILPVPLTVLDEPIAGVARARNRGWRGASAAAVAFIDDDCYPEPDLVDRVARTFETRPELGFLGGAVLLHDSADASVATIQRSDRYEIRPGTFIAAGTVISANLAFRKSVLESIGGFDEAFGYGNGLSGEDADAVARASAAGWQGLYDPQLVVHHDHGRRRPEEVEQVRRAYDLGRGAYYAKCLLDRRLRRIYLAGWARLTLERLRRGQRRTATLRELRGAARYLGLRLRRP